MTEHFRGAVISLFQDSSITQRLAGAAITAVVSAIWHSLTSTLAALLAIFFLADIGLGVLKSLHREGIDGFDGTRFLRGILKFVAAMMGIAVVVGGDLLLQETGVPSGWNPLTSAFLFGACWGFFWSAIQNLEYFFPEVRNWVDQAMKRKPPAIEEPPADEALHVEVTP